MSNTASIDEAAAMKRNVVHQTRLKLELKQLEKDQLTRLQELSHDSQAFVKRLEFISTRSKTRTCLPSLTRVASAPPTMNGPGSRVRLCSTSPTREESDLDSIEELHLNPFIKAHLPSAEPMGPLKFIRSKTTPPATYSNQLRTLPIPREITAGKSQYHKHSETIHSTDSTRESTEAYCHKTVQKSSKDFASSSITRSDSQISQDILSLKAPLRSKGERVVFAHLLQKQQISRKSDTPIPVPSTTVFNTKKDCTRDEKWDKKEDSISHETKKSELNSHARLIPSQKKVNFCIKDRESGNLGTTRWTTKGHIPQSVSKRPTTTSTVSSPRHFRGVYRTISAPP